MQIFVEIHQTVLEISQFLDFQDGGRPPSLISKTSNLVASCVGRVNMHHGTKVHQNQSSGFGDITINGFQNDGRPHRRFLNKNKFLSRLYESECQYGSMCKSSSKSAKQFWRNRFSGFLNGGRPPSWISKN